VLKDELARMARDPNWSASFEAGSEVLGVDAFGDSGIAIRTALRTAPGAQWAVAREFRLRIKKRFDQEGIEIPYPQRTVHVRGDGTPLPGGG